MHSPSYVFGRRLEGTLTEVLHYSHCVPGGHRTSGRGHVSSGMVDIVWVRARGLELLTDMFLLVAAAECLVDRVRRWVPRVED